MNDWLNTILESLIEIAYRRVSFVPDKIVEPRAPQDAAQVESDAELPQMANILKDLKPPSLGEKKKNGQKMSLICFCTSGGTSIALEGNLRL